MDLHKLKKKNIHKHSFQQIGSTIRFYFRKKKLKIFSSITLFYIFFFSFKFSTKKKKKIKTINEFVLSLYNLKARQILSTEINKIKINCTQNATNNNQVLLFNQSNEYIVVMLTFLRIKNIHI